ncbi:MAG: arsenate-mycothiol transferase ArsC [Promethearchaeota archaeon]
MNNLEFWNKMHSSPPHHLIFLCAGNICRSPYAGMMFEKLVGESAVLSLSDFNIQSGGFLKQKSVIIHPFSKKALEEEGIPLSRIDQHRPRTMRKHKDELLNASALIVMTENHRDVLLPAKYRGNAILLSEVAENITLDLPDPALYTDNEKYHSLMNQIKRYLQIMVHKLEEIKN